VTAAALPIRASFPPRGDSVAAARRFVRTALGHLGMRSLVDDAVLMVSELATNAVVHAGTAFEVTCVDLGAAVRIEVHDRHPARELPAALPERDSVRTGGRGLLACAALASAWGVEYTRDGKTVWCRLDVPERAARDHAAPGGTPWSGQVAVGVITLDAEGRVRGWNADAEALLGWSAGQVLGQPLAALRDHSADLEAAPGSGLRWQGEVELRRRDGAFVPVFVSQVPYAAQVVGRAGRTEQAGGGGDSPAAVWLVVPAAQRGLLEQRPEPVDRDDSGGTHWAAFSRSELNQLELDDLLHRAVQRACDAVDGDAAYIVMFDEDTGEGYVSASTGLTAAASAVLRVPAERSGMLDRLPAVYDDLADEPSLPALAGTTMRSAVVVPLVVEGRLIGRLVVASTTPGGFGNHDAMRMQQAADHLALSIESCRIAEMARRHRGWLGYLADASDLLAGTLDPRMTLAMLAQLMVPRIASWCAIGTRDAHNRTDLSHVWHEDEARIDVLRGVLERRLGELTAAADTSQRAVVDGEPVLFLPLRARGRSLGMVVIGDPAGGRFDQDAVELAEELSRRAALTLDNALLYRNQLTASEALQRSLLPASLPEVPNLEVGVAYIAAEEGQQVGGDFYDLFTVGPDRWRFTIGDVCGSGPEAAAVTGQARHVLRILGRQVCPVAEAVRQLNDALREERGPAPFMTVVHGEITPRPGGGMHVEMVAAGHPLPFLLSPSGQAHLVGSNQPLLGVLADPTYRTDAFDLLPDQSLLCVTDGVLERRRGGRMLGENDIDDLLAQCHGLSASATATCVQRVVVEYADEPPRDDLAVLVLRALAPAAPGQEQER
jgi:serine phosphatase RsbU (regulator of sigma subunit)/PAS domain-containing protein